MSALLQEVAATIDFALASDAPLNTDGATPQTDEWEKKAADLVQAIKKPIASLSLVPAVLDFLRNSKTVGINDRLGLLEGGLGLMSRAPPDLELAAKLQQSVISLLYNDLPHPPDFLTTFDSAALPPNTTSPTTKDGQPVTYAFRSADGSNYNPEAPSLGMAGSPYARSVPPTNRIPQHMLPDAGEVFDQILSRKKFVPHPGGISSLFFAFADLVIHCIFDTDHHDYNKNQTSSYLDLSILYGNSESDVDQVRRKDGSGKLWDDVFSDARLLLMPPASCALLVLMNRNHNFIAEKLLDINENGTYVSSPKTDEDLRIQDDEIFHRTRLINCGFFMNIILGDGYGTDYVGAILGLVADGSSWRLDALMDMRQADHKISPRGEGNAVSVEFNLLYRWHATLSRQDEAWTEQEFKNFFPGQDLSKVTPKDFIDTAHRLLIPEPDLKKRSFGGLKRGPDGRFNDDDLARVIQDATEWRAGAYSSGCPEALRVIEVLGIEQSRNWGTCSLNEFRKFLSLKPYDTFAEWNSDPRIHNAAAALYNNDINNLELHVGLQAEQCKEPGIGAGLCPGYTISRAILSDAICLTRGDPYLTTKFNTTNFTQWGYEDCQYDKKDGSFGGLLTKLLFRTLPNNYPVGSAYAHFPFLVPEYIKAKNPALSGYKWERPSAVSLKPTPINTYAGAKQVLEDPSFLSPVNGRLTTVISKQLKDLNENALAQGRATVEKLIYTSNHTPSGTWAEYFQKEARDLIKEKSTKNDDNSKTVDIVGNVINLLPVHWIAEEIFGLPLKTESNKKGALREIPTYEDFAALGRYVFSTVDPADDWHLRLDSEEAFKKLLKFSEGRFDQTNAAQVKNASAFRASLISKFRQFFFSATRQTFLVDPKVENTKPSLEFAARVIAAFKKGQQSNAELAAYSVAAAVPTSPHFSQAIAHVVDFYLGDDKKVERADIVKLSASIGKNSDSAVKIMAYVREALRLNPPVSGIFRTAGENIPVSGFGTIEFGSRVLVDLRAANLDPKTFTDNPSVVNCKRTTQGLLWNENGLLSPLFFDTTVPTILGIILGLKNIRRTVGNPGTFSTFEEPWNGTIRRLYLDGKGEVTPFPCSLKVDCPPMSYVIFGRAIKNEYLALGVFTTFFGGVGLAMRGGPKENSAGQSLQKAREAVPINAGSNEEEQFIKNFIAEAEKEEAHAKH
ncbi:hypothetical protein C0991_008364 [Blastosporella zonata]|nr:hypothetical protein C0991_008364 [Blastosporella zonata]